MPTIAGPLAVLLAAAALSAAPSATAATETPAKKDAESTVYARLGGYDGIARFVDTAFPRVATHPQLTRLFRGHSRDSQVRQRQLIIDALCQATGGPCAYTGRPMKPVHTGLGITSADWTVFTGIVRTALDELKVAPAAREELIELLERRFRPDVVEAP